MLYTGRIIGVDESGKGDFFGPLVVAGCLVSDSDLSLIAGLGVRDSKKIADKKILTIDDSLRSHLTYAVVVYSPEDYNRRYKQIKNLNKLLAAGHAEAITAVIERLTADGSEPADMAVSDKFGKEERLHDALATRRCEIPIHQMVRGEALPAVAAASIIARAEFIRQMDKLSETFGMVLPKGAAPQVDRAGRTLVADKGPNVLLQTAKIHFKNYQRVINPGLFS